MNSQNINPLTVHNPRYDSAIGRNKIIPVSELETARQAEHKASSSNKRKANFELNQSDSSLYRQKSTTDAKYYRAHLLNEIINTMSGVEPRFNPGQFVEYYA